MTTKTSLILLGIIAAIVIAAVVIKSNKMDVDQDNDDSTSQNGNVKSPTVKTDGQTTVDPVVNPTTPPPTNPAFPTTGFEPSNN